MKENAEQTEISVSKIGKFNSPDDLLAAYNALESEFTKRCQLIKQLQAAVERSAQAAERSDDAENAEAAAKESAQPPKPLSEEQASEGATELCAAREESAVAADEKAKNEQPFIDGENDGSIETPEERDILAEVRERALDIAEALCEIPEVFDAAIARYKRKLIGLGGGAASPQGAAVLAPVKRPRTLSDAKRLADEMLSL